MTRINTILCLFGITIYLIIGTAGNEALVGGQFAGVNEYRYHVSIQIPKKGHMCGGGIIDDYFIITVAHCVVTPDNRIDPRPRIIVAGTEDLHHIESPAVIGHVAKIYTTTEFNSHFDSTTGDIAILKLKNSLHVWIHRNMKKLDLPNPDNTYVDKPAVFAAFGQYIVNVDQQKIRMSDKLRYSVADIISTETCQEGYAVQAISKKHICARIRQFDDNMTRGTCRGDSGSPLVIKEKIIVGVLSRGPAGCTEKLKAGIYTRVSSYLKFIEHAKNDVKGPHIRSLPLIGS